MKVVVSCGGLGTRLREHSETIPKLESGAVLWQAVSRLAPHREDHRRADRSNDAHGQRAIYPSLGELASQGPCAAAGLRRAFKRIRGFSWR